LWLLIAAAYSNSQHGRLVFDSAPIVLDDPRVHAATLSNVHQILTGDYWYRNAGSGLYRPLTTFSYLVNYDVLGNGPRPEGYHWVNLALHLTNILLVYLLGLAILEEIGWAWMLAALWGVHPVLTEAVTNIVGRADLLMAMGVLAGLLCYLRSLPAQGREKILWLVAMSLAQLVALFSKESGVVLVGLILLYELTFGASPGRGRRLLICLVPWVIYFYLRSGVPSHLTIPFFENPLSAAGFLTSRLTAVKVIGRLAWLFIWPVTLSADYSFNAVPVFGWSLSWEDAQTVLALLFCVGALLLAVRWRRTHAAAAFFIGFFFVAMAPTANIVMLIGSIMAERFLYLGSIGLAGCLVLALRTAGARLSRTEPVWIAAAVLCLLFAVRTHARNLDWQSEQSLWTSAVEAYPAAARPHNNLGNALLKVPGQLPRAIAEFQTALRILPTYGDAHYNLGTALAQSPGRLPDAIGEYRAALRVDPGNAKAHINLGTALAQTPGHAPEAVAELNAAVRLQPDSAEAHYNLGNALSQLAGRVSDAIAEYQTALRIDPDYAPAHNNLGSLYSAIPGRLADAIAEYRAALRSQPDYAKAHNNLANALAQVPGDGPEAVAEYQAAIRIQPDFADAHYNLGVAWARMPEHRNEAIAELEAAYRLDPNPDTQRALEWLKKNR
jgi:tetratricopeptide (TPR) repeat protein